MPPEVHAGGRLADDHEPAKGVVYDGRIANEFKLISGASVHVGALRVAAITTCAPIVQDAVVIGHDREEVGLLAFASPAGCAGLCPGAPPGTPRRAEGMMFSAISLRVGGSERRRMREPRLLRIRKSLVCYFFTQSVLYKNLSSQEHSRSALLPALIDRENMTCGLDDQPVRRRAMLGSIPFDGFQTPGPEVLGEALNLHGV
jgi:hypothetical protein